MKLVGFAICPFTQRARAVLCLKGIAHEARYVPLGEPTAALLDVSPEGEGPALATDLGAVIGSRPIVEFLEETQPDHPLYPPDPIDRARARSWLDVSDRTYLALCSFLRAEGVVRMERRQELLLAYLERLEAALGSAGAPFLGGEGPSVADAAWFPVVHRIALLARHTDHDVLADLPSVAGYRDRLLALEPLRRSASDDFEDRFVDFYLSNLTHLGRLMLVRRGRSGESQPETSEDEPLRRCR